MHLYDVLDWEEINEWWSKIDFDPYEPDWRDK